MKTYKFLLLTASLLALVAAPALAYEEGAWILRGGVGTVQPNSNGLTISDEDFGSIVFDVDDATNMTLNATYMFTRHWAFDVLAALPFEHDIHATMNFDSVSEKVKIAETKQIPATFSVQYHFSPDSEFQPYAGLGFNWTTFSSTKFVSLPSSMFEDSDFEYEELGGLKIDDSFGVALQVGGDWNIGERMVLNFDVRWFDIDADTYYLDPLISGEEKLGSMKVDPFFYALNLGFHF